MAVSVVRKLERCEKLGRARQGETILNGENYQVIKYKIKIKDYFTTNQIKLDRSVMGSLNYVAPSNEEIKSKSLQPAWRLQYLQAQAAGKGCSPILPPCKLQQIAALHEQGDSNGAPSSPSPPCKLHQIILQEQKPPLKPHQNLHQLEEDMQLHSLQDYEEDESCWLQHPWKLQENVLHEHGYSNSSSQAMPRQALTLQPSKVQENEEASCASSPWKLQESSNKLEEEIKWGASLSPSLQQTVKEREEDSSSPYKLQKATEEEKEQMESEEDGRGLARSPWKLQELQEKAGGGVWEGVKKIECECCGMEEECTGGYEEKVRAGLRGHWLCGLCEEAVGEERKRVGGNVQAALAAHMQPCRRFSRRARSKASPPPSDVALPHAVCRLLCRHLSTPPPRSSSSPSPSLSRSCSCLPSLPNQ